MASETVIFSRDFFYFIKKNYQSSIKDKISDHLKEIDLLVDHIVGSSITNKNTANSKNWRISKPKSFIIKDNLSKEEEISNKVNSFLNKLSPKNFDVICKSVLDICLENKDDENIKDIILDSIFLKAVMQSIYCPYYVRLINNIIDEKINITSIINKKSKEYQHMLKMENKKNLTSSEKETYDEFCEKIKNKTYKAGYSQFIGELLKNKIISEFIVKDCLKLFIDNLNALIKEKSDSDSIEDNLICAINLLKTTHNIIDYKDLLESLIKIKDTGNLKIRLKFKIMDLCDELNK